MHRTTDKLGRLRPMIIYVYNSYDDPLFRGILLPFMKHAALAQPDLRFHLITYEQQDWPLTPEQRQQVRADLALHNTVWYPLTWHSGRFKLLKKLYDLVLGTLLVLKLRITTGAGSIGALCTIAGSFAFLMAKLMGLRYYGFWYEPHSEFMRDFNIWPTSGLAYRGLHYMEGLSGRHADVLTTGTVHMMKRLQEWGSKAKVFKLPSCVDETKIYFRPEGRTRIRATLPIQAETPVILYLGKFGGIYYDREIAALFRTMHELNPALFFLIVSPDPVSHIAGLMQQEGVPASHYAVTRSPYSEVQDYISAADFGVVAIPALSAQQFRSPIKVGEYLCCGLPYLVCRGISEDDAVAEQKQVGVVVKDFSAPEIRAAYPEIERYLHEDKSSQRERCRAAGIAYRGVSQYLATAEAIFATV